MRNRAEKNIWLDIDDTIAVTWPIMVRYGVNYCNEKNLCIQLDFTIECEDDLYFADILNIKGDQITDFFDRNYPHYLPQIEPDYGAKECLYVLRKHGYNINLLSARREKNGQVKGITKAWLKEHLIPYDTLTINCKDKASFLKGKKGFFIDDSYKHCTDVKNKTSLTVIQKRCPFSKVSLGVFQGTVWKEILDYILAVEDGLTLGKL